MEIALALFMAAFFISIIIGTGIIKNLTEAMMIALARIYALEQYLGITYEEISQENE